MLAQRGIGDSPRDRGRFLLVLHLLIHTVPEPTSSSANLPHLLSPPPFSSLQVPLSPDRLLPPDCHVYSAHKSPAGRPLTSRRHQLDSADPFPAAAPAGLPLSATPPLEFVNPHFPEGAPEYLFSWLFHCDGLSNREQQPDYACAGGIRDSGHARRQQQGLVPTADLKRSIRKLGRKDEISKQQIKIMQNNQNICQIRKYEKKHMVQKPSGDVRICMDPRELNKYVQRERYILPTAETIFSELKGATVFSVFDASSAFWQVPLDKESTNLCTIATPFGRFRFKRLPYGLNSASEVFQRCINNILSGLQGTACYMDDILIYGNTMEEHNRNLETVLRRLEENNVKLNAKKQQIAVNKVNFLGHIISRDGIAIQASRAEAIQKLKRPENKTEVQRFLGMVTYLGKFIPNLSDKTAPLRKLISNKSEWKFGGEENDCFEKLKNMVSNAPILTFFDPTKPITISSDASQYGIGTVLMQGGQAIEYASFSLNATQRKYAQIEKELLAIVFGCERFHVEDSAPTSQSPSIPGSQAGTAMDDNIQDHGRPTSENRRAYDPRENVAKKGDGCSAQHKDIPAIGFPVFFITAPVCIRKSC
ncbi:K02A2.6-like [Cordylochernes scorpioides]|uniref:K02A2.6-like n=1 Tax=Cordylochernes scorpioides TaxID=51811 RepID=A0ABY6JY82_9ARAC|nr:K02A2.6-like [Cordylochernes scorpioides]